MLGYVLAISHSSCLGANLLCRKTGRLATCRMSLFTDAAWYVLPVDWINWGSVAHVTAETAIAMKGKRTASRYTFEH